MASCNASGKGFSDVIKVMSNRTTYIISYNYNNERRDSVVGIAIGYGLDDRGVGVRVPVGSRISFLQVLQTGSRVHLTSYLRGTETLSPWVKR
jgi:hypothetical protein